MSDERGRQNLVGCRREAGDCRMNEEGLSNGGGRQRVVGEFTKLAGNSEVWQR